MPNTITIYSASKTDGTDMDATIEYRRIQKADVNQVSTPKAVDAYRKLHFEPAVEEQCVNGIRFVPMAINGHQSNSS